MLDLSRQNTDTATRNEVQRLIDSSASHSVQIPDSSRFLNGAVVWTGSGWTTVPNAGQLNQAGTGLPKTANNDDEAFYKAATGVYWYFKYEAATRFWNFTGGPPLTALDGTVFTSTLTNTYQSMIPTITVPLAGDYEVWASVLSSQATSAATHTYGPGVGALPTNGSQFSVIAAGVASPYWWQIYTGVAISTLVTCYGQTNDVVPGHTTWTNKRLWIRPIRVQA